MQRGLTYSSSDALSAEHYKLVTALEGTANQATTNILATQLAKIHTRLNCSQSPSSIRHDLILALYCQSQRPQLTTRLEADSLSLEFCLPAAVKLAGGGREASVGDRRTGYRACDELFTEQPHELKLLLINTISQDLYAPPGSSNAEARWTMGLRAAASPRIVCAELVPAISDRVVELMSWRTPSIRRQALATLLALTRFSRNPSLLSTTRRLVLSALSPMPEKSSSTANPSESDPRVVSALVQAASTKSILHPLAPAQDVINLFLGILKRVVDQEWKGGKWDYHGVYCGWLAATTLGSIEGILVDGKHEDSTQSRVLAGVLEFLETVKSDTKLSPGLILAALRCLNRLAPTTIDSISSSQSTALSNTLAIIRTSLQSKDPNLQLFALRYLRNVPASIWTSLKEEGWGDEVFGRIMGFLENPDPTLRKEALRLLYGIDPQLAELHMDRLEKSLESLDSQSTNRRVRDHLVFLILEGSSIVDIRANHWIDRLDALVFCIKEPVIDILVVETLDRYSSSPEDVRTDFSMSLLGRGGWMKDISLGLLVAATAGGGSSDEGTRLEVLRIMSEWLADASGRTTSPTILHPLQEPFVLSLLRQASRMPDSLLASLDKNISRAALLATPSSRPSFELYSRCRSDSTSKEALRLAADDPRSSTLPGFVKVLHGLLGSPSIPVAAKGGTSSERPLRYSAYASPKSTSSSPKSTADEKERHMRGGRGGMADSLMSPGALALVGIEQDLSDNESDSSLPRIGPVPSHGRDESTGGSPPAGLLIELGVVDPFHNGDR